MRPVDYSSLAIKALGWDPGLLEGTSALDSGFLALLWSLLGHLLFQGLLGLE